MPRRPQINKGEPGGVNPRGTGPVQPRDVDQPNSETGGAKADAGKRAARRPVPEKRRPSQ